MESLTLLLLLAFLASFSLPSHAYVSPEEYKARLKYNQELI